MAALKIAVIILFSTLFVACLASDTKNSGIVIAESKSYEASLFRQNCAICHGAEANGKQMDNRLIPSLRFGHAATLSEQEIYLQIKEGKLPMPSFKKQLSEEEISKMVKFVMRDLQGRKIAD